jgi:hypothetical protein
MVTIQKCKYSVFLIPKSIFIFQKWTKINVQFSIFENNLGFLKNITFYIINGQNNLKRRLRDYY